MGAQCITVHPSDALVGLTREYHTRKKGAYVLFDKHGQYLVVSQKLHNLAAFVNSVVPDAASRVSITALHDIVNKCDVNNRVGGWSKHRWKLQFAPLEGVGGVFESERSQFQHALILGQPECYTIKRA
jgi:hypothetical protein